MLIEIMCPVCGKNHKVPKSRLEEKRIRVKLCSNACYQAYKIQLRKQRERDKTHICNCCGKKFISDRRGKSGMYFCSQECSRQYMRNENSPFYKNGVTYNNGYKTVRIGFKKYGLEHRLIMEKHIGRKLTPDEVVHHRDGNKLNNNISNLQLMTKAEHDKLHFMLRSKETNNARTPKRRPPKCTRTV